MSFARLQTRTRHSSAFTLVELMIVIAIVGVLASLIAVGVMKAFERSKLVSARIEISQLEAAVSAAKLDLGNVDELPSRLRIANSVANFSTASALPGETPADVTLRLSTWSLFQKAFGKTIVGSGAPAVFNWRGPGNAPNAGNVAITLDGMEALMFWLGGIVENGKFTGFAASKTDPTLTEAASSKRKGPYYQFETTRVSGTASTGKLGYNNAWDGPFLYFSKSYYNTPINGVNAYRSNNTPATLPATYPPYPASYFYNPKTFQIISSGQDQTFGPGGYYQPPFTIGVPGYDDLSNFSSTVLGKKDE